MKREIFRRTVSMMRPWLGTAACLVTAAVMNAHAAGQNCVISDFEGENYGAWKTTGEAFGKGPVHGTLPGQMVVSGYKGKGLASSYNGGDDPKGTLTSPEFKIQKKYISFLIGGGKNPEKLALQLLVDGKVVRTATGSNDQPGGTEALAPDFWDVSQFIGQMAIIRIVDDVSGGWGHISVDELMQSDCKPDGILIEGMLRKLSLNKQYLNFPVKNGAQHRVMTVAVEGEAPRHFDIELADGAPDWWAFMDVSLFRGKEAQISVDRIPNDSLGLKTIDQTDKIKNSERLYRENLRPQFHFSSRRGWLNDPNGLVYHKGEYHLFYQHNPYGVQWGNMHWGHAVSKDMVHWVELSEALYPDPLGTMFSGSAVIDKNNTAGFKTGSEDVMVCIYTAAGDCSVGYPKCKTTQGLAYSNDRGRTWAKYSGNPVLPHIIGGNRDPKVFWYAPENKWVMALFLDGNEYALFSSKDLKKWEEMSRVTIPNTGECPEFFEIPLEGNKQDTRWVFYGGTGAYWVGRFDGRHFKQEAGPFTIQSGNCWYASQTYNNIPASDGRRILVPWANGVEMPGMPFNQMMGIPVELTLHNTKKGPQLFANPIHELESLRVKSHTITPQILAPGENPLATLNAELVDLLLDVTCQDANEVELSLRGVTVNYDVKAQELSCLDRRVPLKMVDGKISLRILVDRTSVDIFGNDGRLYMPMKAVIQDENRWFAIQSHGGEARINSLVVHELKSAWKK